MDPVAGIAVGMTSITGIALANKSGHFVMFVSHIAAIVLVTNNAAEHGIIIGVRMTIAAAIPFIAMSSGINGEIQSVMIELCVPVERRMAHCTVLRKSGRCMIGILRVIVIGLVAEEAISGRSGILPIEMAIQTSY